MQLLVKYTYDYGFSKDIDMAQAEDHICTS